MMPTKLRRHLVQVVASLVITPLVPLALEAQQNIAAETTVIRAGHLFDARAGQMLANRVLVISGDRIQVIGGTDAKIPAGARVIDLSNATVLPGLIDAHTHLTMDAGQTGYETLGISAPRAALTGAKNARITLLAGFTTVRNLGAEGYSDVALRDAIDAGDIIGPRMQVSGPPLGATGGHCDNSLLPPSFGHAAEGVAERNRSSTRSARSSSTALTSSSSADLAECFPKATTPSVKNTALRK
jgi:imidazolonepropionase-like amidohydrolase